MVFVKDSVKVGEKILASEYVFFKVSFLLSGELLLRECTMQSENDPLERVDPD